MGGAGSKACYAFWGAERFCHLPVVRACGSPRIPPGGLRRLSRNPLGNLLRFG